VEQANDTAQAQAVKQSLTVTFPPPLYTGIRPAAGYGSPMTPEIILAVVGLTLIGLGVASFRRLGTLIKLAVDIFAKLP
jgi:hypothetical protein